MKIRFPGEGATVNVRIGADGPSDGVLHRRDGKGVNGENPGHS